MIIEIQTLRDKDGNILDEKFSVFHPREQKREKFNKEQDIKAYVEKKGIKWSSFKRDKS
uniref:Uncharacterized protein n=1 Tax=viral metagenome TaxID=1070528 RepID=A0A6H2A1U3_9ZZZZ